MKNIKITAEDASLLYEQLQWTEDDGVQFDGDELKFPAELHAKATKLMRDENWRGKSRAIIDKRQAEADYEQTIQDEMRTMAAERLKERGFNPPGQSK